MLPEAVEEETVPLEVVAWEMEVQLEIQMAGLELEKVAVHILRMPCICIADNYWPDYLDTRRSTLRMRDHCRMC